MDVAQDLVYKLYLFYAINNSIFKSIRPIEGTILLKNHVSCNFMLKYYITFSIRQFGITLNQFFIYLWQMKIWKFLCLFDLCSLMN